MLSKELLLQGAAINSMSCAKIRRDLAIPDPRFVGCVCASKLNVTELIWALRQILEWLAPIQVVFLPK